MGTRRSNITLTAGKPYKVILLFALPVVLGNLAAQVYGFVDTAIIGRFLGYRALAGVGSTSGLQFLVCGSATGLTTGLGIAVAQHFGSGNVSILRKSIASGFLLCLLGALVLAAFSVPLVNPALAWTDTPSGIAGYASEYLMVLFGGIISTVAFTFSNSLLWAVGDSRTPLINTVLSFVLNAVLSFCFLGVLRLGAAWAAVATIISQLSASFVNLLLFRRHYRGLWPCRTDFVPDLELWAEHLRLGLPIAMQSAVIAVGMIVMQQAVNGFDNESIAGFVAAKKIQAIVVSFGVSLGTATANYTAQNFGSGNMIRVRKGFLSAMVISFSVCVILAVSVYACSGIFVSWMVGGSVNASDPLALSRILEASEIYSKCSALLLPAVFAMHILRNFVQGLGNSFCPFVAGAAETVVRVLVSMFLPACAGFLSIPLADGLAWLADASVLALWLVVRGITLSRRR